MTAWYRVYPGSALPRRLTTADVDYLDSAVRRAYGVFVDDPATGLELARTMAATVLNRRGFDADEVLRSLPGPPGVRPRGDPPGIGFTGCRHRPDRGPRRLGVSTTRTVGGAGRKAERRIRCCLTAPDRADRAHRAPDPPRGLAEQATVSESCLALFAWTTRPAPGSPPVA